MSKSLCQSCGRAANEGDAFCRGCGTPFDAPGRTQTLGRKTDPDLPTRLDQDRCESCNALLDGDSDFCPSCGARNARPGDAPTTGASERLRAHLEEATRGEYEIVRELGKGGMGSVFLARDPSLERHVAIKVLAPHLVTDEQMLARFQTEARIVGTLRHPGIVAIHKFRHTGDLLFFVMDYIEGVPLRSVIRSHGPLAPDVVRALLYDVGSAISYAHSRGGIVHRDLKPSNIMLESGGSALVTDFGISRAVSARTGLTHSGVIIGTPEYMSPEQCRGGKVTPASDQYALGLVAYAMLVGAPPFSGQHYAVLAAQTSQPPTPIQEMRPDCPEDLVLAVHRMLAKSPTDRFPEIKEALKACGARPHEDGDPVRREIARLIRTAGDAVAPMIPVVSIGVAGMPEQMEAGDTVSLEITPVDGLGRVLTDRPVAIVSKEPDVARIAEDGSVVAVTEGTAHLVITCEELESEVRVHVRAPEVATLEILVPGGSLEAGEVAQLLAVPLSRRGNKVEGMPVAWSSSDPRVASISADGAVHAQTPGAARITARCGPTDRSVELTVTPPPVASLELVNAPEVMRLGDRLPLKAVASGRLGQVLGDRKVTWTTATPQIARVSQQGEVVTLAPGEARLVASCEGKRAEARFAVLPSAVEQVWLTAIHDAVAVGQRVRLDLTVMDGRSNLLTDRAARWESSRPEIATVSEAGEVLGVRPGSTEIRATVEGRSAAVEVQIVAALAVPAAPPTIPVPPTSAVPTTSAAPVPRPAPRPPAASPAAQRTRADVASDRPVIQKKETQRGSRRRVVGVLALSLAGVAVVGLVGKTLWDGGGADPAPETQLEEAEALPGGGGAQPASGGEPATGQPGDQPSSGSGGIDAAATGPATDQPAPQPQPSPPAVTTITLTRAGGSAPVTSLSLDVGESAELRGAAIDAAGRAAGGSVSWTSSNPAVAAVDGAGRVSARRSGSAVLTASAGGVAARLPVTVVAQTPGTLQLIVLPFADIYVDDVRRATGERALQLQLAPGRHRLRLETPSALPRDTVIVIEAGQTTAVQIRLQPREY
jgi:uncharacterized protein YjdB/RNA polymerase subunit RPABC4/transcription elongation factor Spt4